MATQRPGDVLATLLRQYRRAAGLTQEELAQKAEVSPRTIRNAENAHAARVRSSSVRRIAAALPLTAEQLAAIHAALRAAAVDGEPPVAVADVASRPRAVPAQLPPDVAAFIGRTPEIAQLDALCGLAPTAGTGPTHARPAIAVISGMPGVGKTGLAVRWAHANREAFPDGQLYVNLRGYDPDLPVEPDVALAGFLNAFGVSNSDIPLDLWDRAARLRTELSSRRVLLLLDNAASVDQVRPLLPGTGDSVVLVTSRDSLAGLVATAGARRLDLGLLRLPDAVDLLRQLIGQRVDLEPDAAAMLVEHCARLPLALRVAAELAAARMDAPLAALADELADQQRRLGHLDGAGYRHSDVAAVFSWSLRHLEPFELRLFTLIGLHPGTEFDAYAAAALAGSELDRTERALRMLGRAHLVDAIGANRYALHDLLRAYAVGLAAKDAEHGQLALHHLVDYYQITAMAAISALYPDEARYLDPVRRDPAAPPLAVPEAVRHDTATAVQWLDTERRTIIDLTAKAACLGWQRQTMWFSTALFRYLAGKPYVDALELHRIARQAAHDIGDAAGEGNALLGLCHAHIQCGDAATAAALGREALRLHTLAGDATGEGRAYCALATVDHLQSNFDAAADLTRRGLALFQLTHFEPGEARTTATLGALSLRQGRLAEARAYLSRALVLFRRIHGRDGQAEALNNLGCVERQLDQHDQATEHFTAALTLYQDLGNQRGEAWALDNLGSVALQTGHPQLAQQHHRQALDICRTIGDRDGEAWVLNGLGEAALAGRHPAEATTWHTAAFTVAARTGARDQKARARAGLADAAMAANEHDHARQHLRHAIRLYDDLDPQRAAQLRDRLARIAPTA
jgi:tetratricopeptide (TPR) repeat protein/transcriptional regulator with XRE-family HTH domain